MMQIAKTLFRSIMTFVRGSRRLFADRSGIVATEYCVAMAIVALGMLGTSPISTAVPLPVAKPIAGIHAPAGATMPVGETLAIAQAEGMYAPRTTVVIMYADN